MSDLCLVIAKAGLYIEKILKLFLVRVILIKGLYIVKLKNCEGMRMSLSKIPPVKITSNTAQEVSDEILGGAIQLCKEASYKQNMQMLTFFWVAFLLANKKILDENGIYNDTVNCFGRSLGKVFPKVSGDQKLQEKINNIRKYYWNRLSECFTSLHTEEEISAFIKIADELNAHGNTEVVYQPKKDSVEIFARFSADINSSIYGILHDIDNGLTIRYKHVPDMIQYEQWSQKNQNTNIKPESDTKKEKPLGMKWYKFLIYFALIAGAVINFVCSFNYISGNIYLAESNRQISAEQVYDYYGAGLKIVDIIYGLFLIAFAILGLMLRHKLANYKPDSLKFVKIFYSVDILIPLLYIVVVSVITKQMLPLLVVQGTIYAVISLVFLLVNVKYFKKRVHLFVGKETSEQSSPLLQTPSEQIDKNKQISGAKEYCSRCGSLIDFDTKICTGCGKQYIKGIRITKSLVLIVVLSILLIVSIFINITQLKEITEIDSQRRSFEERIDNLQSEISDLEYKLYVNQNIVDFIDEYVVFVEDDGTNLYHKFNCHKFIGNNFWVYNIEAAIGWELSPCPYCY